MGFWNDDAEDLSNLFTEFGEEAVYTKKTGEIVNLTIITDYRDNLGRSGPGQMAMGTFLLRRADVSIPLYGEKIEIDGAEWTITRQLEADKNLVTVEVRRDVRVTVK